MKFSLPDFALARPITVVMLSISTLAVGLIAWDRMPLNFLPRVDRPFIGVSIPYPNASPEQVEQQVAIPVEGEFRTLSGLRRIRTISNSDGCFVSMQFNLETDMTLATAEVRDRIERLKLVLPDDVDTLLIQRFSSRSIPAIALGVFRDGDESEFINDVRTLIEPRIRRQEGVANVEILTPVQENEVLIEFEQDTLRSMNLGLAEVIAMLRESSFNMSVGQLLDSGQRNFVRVVGEYRQLDDVKNLVVSPTGLRLKDVATVRYASRDETAHVALDGQGGAIIMVTKESEANTVETVRNVHDEMERILADPMFADVNVRVFFDQAELITSALGNLFAQGIYGGIMAITVLFIFLHRVRPTIIVALSIPTSLLIAFVAMFFADMSLNLVTMVSMIIAVGMLVDNAIVVVENIIRHRQMGEDRFESAKNGASEVGLAIFAATTTTWVVFVPMYYLEAGQMSVFMEQLGFPLIVALGGSLLGALTLIPLAMSRMKDSKHANLFERIEYRLGLIADPSLSQHPEDGTPVPVPKRKGFLAALGKAGVVDRIIQIYASVLRTSQQYRVATVAVLAMIIYVTYLVPYQHVGMRDLPKLDTREVKIDIELDQNYTMDMARELFGQIEEQINMWRDELAIKSVLSYYEMGGGVIEMYLMTADDGPAGRNPPYDTESVMRIVSERLPRSVPGGELRFTVTESGDTGQEAGVSVQLRGDDMAVLETYAERFRRVMEAIPSVSDVTSSVERDSQEMQLHIDGFLAGQHGVTPLTVATTVDAALRGARLPFMKQGGREIPVWAQFREEDRKSRANLDNVAIMTDTGDLVPVNQLVDYQPAPAASSIMRVDGKNVVTLTGRAESDNMTMISRELQAAAARFDMPVGYSIGLGDSLVELDESVFQFATTLLMAVVLIYLVMSALFESFLFPLSILSSVPLALGGAIWMLYFTNTQLDTVTMIGCILMAGIIVNNGIVIIDHINQLRRTMPGRTDAIVQAGMNRFRPVMMTAITTVLGLIPLAMAKTGGAATFAGLGRALIGGLTAGTILTLIIVPLLYSFLDDLQKFSVNYLGGLGRLGERGKSAAPTSEKPETA